MTTCLKWFQFFTLFLVRLIGQYTFDKTSFDTTSIIRCLGTRPTSHWVLNPEDSSDEDHGTRAGGRNKPNTCLTDAPYENWLIITTRSREPAAPQWSTHRIRSPEAKRYCVYTLTRRIVCMHMCVLLLSVVFCESEDERADAEWCRSSIFTLHA